MPVRIKSLRLFVLLAVAGVAGGFLPVPARADDRLTGYWVPAPDKAAPAVFSFGQLGKWTIMTQHWAGADQAAAELKVRYLVTTEGSRGTMTADQNLDKLPDAPRVITYQIEAGRLTLIIDGSVHAGTYELVKGTPPAALPAAGSKMTMPPVSRATSSPPPPAAPAISPWERLLGAWVTDPQDSVQASLFIGRTKKVENFKINQRWVKGSDSPSMSKGGIYTGSALRGHGVLTKDKPDYEGSLIPLTLSFVFEGEALLISVEDGPYAGQHRLTREAK